MKQITYNPVTNSKTMTIQDKTRKLSSTWTLDIATDMEAYHGISIEEIVSKTMQEEIDREIVFDVMREDVKSMGWTRANVSPFPNADEKMEWIHMNAIGDYKIIDMHVWFEIESDLSHFLLRWS